MKKIMFNDKYGLTQAVLEGRKTMTRRIVPQKLLECTRQYSHGDEDEFRYRLMANAPYRVGEIVAVAQRYKDVYPNADFEMLGDGFMTESKGWNNKMFVKAELMPNHIKIAGLRVEFLQDISNEDCLKEGVLSSDKYAMPYGIPDPKGGVFFYYSYPIEAFAALINKVSGKGIFESNPIVWAYEYEMVES